MLTPPGGGADIHLVTWFGHSMAPRSAQLPPGSESQELLLLDPLHSMLDEESAQQVRALIAKGALSPGVMATSDCKGDHATLAERGVEFIQEPAERPYGIEALLRDDSGNWFSFCQR